MLPRLLLPVVLVLALSSGCGDSESDAAAPEPVTTTTTTTVTVEPEPLPIGAVCDVARDVADLRVGILRRAKSSVIMADADRLFEATSGLGDEVTRRPFAILTGAMYRQALADGQDGDALEAFGDWLDAKDAVSYATKLVDAVCR